MVCLIRAKLETSHHCGYCSGNECEYIIEIKYYEVETPEEYINHPLGKLEDITKYDWASLLPEPDVEGDSGYCKPSEESLEAGMTEIHSYRYTVLSVKFVQG